MGRHCSFAPTFRSTNHSERKNYPETAHFEIENNFLKLISAVENVLKD